MTGIDFGRHSDDYATMRPGFPDSFYKRIQQFVALNGLATLDVGTGPGVVALELAQRGADVTGLDVSANQIARGRERVAAAGLSDRCRFVLGSAEDTGLVDSSFDLVTAGQCWTWFDGPAACAEIKRVLKPGGWLIVAHFDYLPLHSAVAAKTEQLILDANPGWQYHGHTGIHAHQIDVLIKGGLTFVEQFAYDHVQSFTHPQWRARIRTCNGVGSGTLTAAQVAAFDRDLSEMLDANYPEPLLIPHRIWVTIARRP